MQPGFDHTPGVLSTIVGYTGGSVPNPSYEEVSSGTTGHYEAIEVIYDPTAVAYVHEITQSLMGRIEAKTPDTAAWLKMGV